MLEPPTPFRHPGLARRLAAMIYDAVLLFAVLFIMTYLIIPFTGGKIILPGNPFYQSYLLIISFLFYGWFWTHGGQTLGMVAWRLRLRRTDGAVVGWDRAALRFLAALCSWSCLGLGFLWIWVDRDRRAWHDLWSKTEIILVEKIDLLRNSSDNNLPARN